jgi:O-antigen/teichoic acid export membrane protein
MDPSSSPGAGERGLRALLHGTLHLIGAQVFRLITQSLLLVLVVRGLGAADYGKVTALQALLVALLPLTHFGTPVLAVRAVARAPERKLHIWGAGLAVTLCLGTLVALAVSLLAPRVLGVDFPRGPLFLFAFSELALVGAVLVLNGILQGEERLKTLARVQAGLSLARLAAMAAVALAFGLDLARFSLASLLGTGLMLVVTLAVVARPWGRPRWPRRWRELWAEIKDGIYFVLVMAGRNFMIGLDKMMLPALFSLTAAAQYGAGFRVVMFALMPIHSFLAAIYPRFFRRGEQSLDASLRLWRRVLVYALGYAVPVALLLLLTAPLARPILGDEFVEAPQVIRVLAGLIVLQALYIPLGDALTGADHFAYRSVCVFIALLVNLALNWLFIPRWGWRGAALAAYLSQALLFLLYFARVWRRGGGEEAGDA